MSIPAMEFTEFVSTGAETFIETEYVPNYVEILNLSSLSNLTSTTSQYVRAMWTSTMGDGRALVQNTLGGSTNPSLMLSSYITGNGIFILPTAYEPIAGPVGSFATVTNTNPVTLTGVGTINIPATGYLSIITSTGSQQLVGGANVFYYTYSTAGGGVVTLPYLSGTSFGTVGGVGTFRVILNYNRQVLFPSQLITSITTGTTTTIGFGVPNKFLVDQWVQFQMNPLFSSQLASLLVPRPFGKTDPNYPGFRITAVGTNTITIALDTSAVTQAFSWPSNGTVSALTTQAFQSCYAIYSGSDPRGLTYATAQTAASQQGIILGTGVLGTAGNLLKMTFRKDLLAPQASNVNG